MSVSLLSSSLGSQPYFSGFFTLRFLHFGPHSCRRLKFNMAASLSANSYNSAIMNCNSAWYKVPVILHNYKHKHACRINIENLIIHGFLELFEILKNYIGFYLNSQWTKPLFIYKIKTSLAVNILVWGRVSWFSRWGSGTYPQSLWLVWGKICTVAHP